MTRKAIGILGAGNVGTALAHALVSRGESVFIGVPSPDKYRDAVARLGPAARIDTTEAAVDCGDLSAARYLEPFAMTWIHMAIKLGHGRRFAFARLRR
jgi:predicted dinucleotide-binding enzyme